MSILKLKKKKRSNFFTKLIVIFIFILFFSYLFINLFSNRASSILFSYAESETRKLTTLIINKAVTKQIASDMNVDDMFDIQKNGNDEIQLVTFNSINVTKILNAITSLVQLNLKAIEEGNVDLMELADDFLDSYNQDKLREGIIYEIPIGVITNATFLANVGPKIPVRLNLIGDVVTGVVSKVSEYGINNALLEIGIKVEVTSKINLPLISKNVTVSTTVPIVMKIIQGKIPNMYFDDIKSSSSIVERDINVLD